jgi:uncharacterized protein (DUF1684 family)
MKSILLIPVLCCLALDGFSQGKPFKDSLARFRKNYITTHEVVKEENRKHFRFFPVSEKFLVEATFEKFTDSSGFTMPSTGKTQSRYYKYGTLYFTFNNQPFKLTVYQSERLLKTSAYKDYLFVPFTDRTNGIKTYGGGRYIDIFSSEIINNKVMLDFNKAYNPYCAYASGYNCPIPPAENALRLDIEAGEMSFAEKH